MFKLPRFIILKAETNLILRWSHRGKGYNDTWINQGCQGPSTLSQRLRHKVIPYEFTNARGQLPSKLGVLALRVMK